jgi:hypothetical protein
MSTDIERLLARLTQHGVAPDGVERVRKLVLDELDKADTVRTDPGTPMAKLRSDSQKLKEMKLDVDPDDDGD